MVLYRPVEAAGLIGTRRVIVARIPSGYGGLHLVLARKVCLLYVRRQIVSQRKNPGLHIGGRVAGIFLTKKTFRKSRTFRRTAVTSIKSKEAIHATHYGGKV